MKLFLENEPTPVEQGKLHVLIMGDDYDSSNMGNFVNVANSIKSFILSVDPLFSVLQK